ncbi:uncharacterized protein M6B38_386315 [Iris pallida]|uniref:IST1-like protein n=1 Tax=Iris pallida TaxID=29817 RepID=A0AAX6G4D6_IRIPA|nr:uncharacterized protein M6B38_386315 [Iris pallida]
MLSKSFKAGKCKTSLKLAAARIKLLRNKREVQVKSMRRELSQLLESGQEQTARIRVEHVIREEKTMSAYDLIELYCELIAARLPIIESQKACPIDLKEAISSVIFASPRCADIPELMDIRKHLGAKYGKEFVNSVLEVRPDCGVSRLVVEKLSARAPDVETKIKILTSIALEYNVKWDSKSFEEQLQKPNDDLLNGPSTFSSSNKVPKETSSVNYQPATNHTKESSTSQNADSKLTSVGSFSYTSSRTSSTSEPFISKPELRAPESNAGGGAVKNSYSVEVNGSSNRPTWNMEFKDATSAAQAAAESAERASLAARAAAELATRENLSRQNSSGSNERSTYSVVKNERPGDISRGSKLKGEDITYCESKNSREVKSETPHFQREATQGVFRRETGEVDDDNSRAQKETSRSSHSSQTNDDDSFLNISSNVTSIKDYNHAPKMSPVSESMEENQKNAKHENTECGRERIVNYGEQTSSPQASTLNDESSRYPEYGNDVVFDDYGYDADDIDVFGSSRVKPLFSHQGEESSVHQSNADLASPKHHTSWSPSKNNSSKLHLFTESEKCQEKTTPVSFSSQSNENAPATFDDSDGLSSDSEDENDYSSHKNLMRPTNVLHNERSSGRNLLREESDHSLSNTFSDDRNKVADIVNRSAPSCNSSGGDKEEYEANSYAAEIFWKKSGSSNSLDNQLSSRFDKAPSNSYDSRRGFDDSSSDEDAQPLRSSNVQSKRKGGTNQQLPSLPLLNNPDIVDESSDESVQGLNFGRLTGGFKHRGFARPLYVRNNAVDDSHASSQSTSETYSISEKPIVSEVEKLSAGGEVLHRDVDDQELLPKAKVRISRTSEASIDSHSMLYDEEVGREVHKESSSRRPITYSGSDDSRAKMDSDFTAENKVNVDVKLSRRTRGMPTEARSSALRFAGRPELESKSSQTSSCTSKSHAAAAHDAVNIHGKDNSKTSRQNLPTKQPTVASKQKSSASQESPKSSQPSSTEGVVPADILKTNSPQSSGGSSSRENSLKNPAHTHPKLPDYDSLAAHFHSLRSNRN